VGNSLAVGLRAKAFHPSASVFVGFPLPTRGRNVHNQEAFQARSQATAKGERIRTLPITKQGFHFV
jgi:hypothetical protein